MMRKMEEMEQRNELIEEKKKKGKNRKAAESAATVPTLSMIFFWASLLSYDAAADRREQLLPMVSYTCVVPFHSRCDRFSNQRN
jgi:hypothetical protein